MRTWGPGAFLCAPSSSPPISRVSPLQPSWSLHPSSCFKWPRHKATGIHLHTMCSVLRVLREPLSTLQPPPQTPSLHRRARGLLLKRDVMDFHFPTSPCCCLSLQILVSSSSPKPQREKTCKIMRLSVSHTSQQHLMMQEAIGMGSLQSRKRLPFQHRQHSKNEILSSYIFCLQPFLPSFSPAVSKIYKENLSFAKSRIIESMILWF